MAAEKGTNTCGCDVNTCPTSRDEPCYDYKCTQCRACCDADCPGCKEKCKTVQKREECKCRIPYCGCPTNCYGNDSNGLCKGKRVCKRCDIRCDQNKKCVCYQCSCGTQCNGVICSCCSWCDPRNCSGKKCNGYVIGRCGGNGPCKGHVKYDEEGAVYDRNAKNQITCDGTPHEGTQCNENNCNWFTADDTKDGCCVKLCKYCGTLCGQDKFRRCCYIAIPVVIILLVFLIFRFMFPEKFQSMMIGIRAAFPISSGHRSRPLSNLVGDKIPEETNIDRYPAFRPRAYAGLA